MPRRFPSTQGRATMEKSGSSWLGKLLKIVLSLLAFGVGVAAFFVIRRYLGRGGEPEDRSTGADLFRSMNERARSGDVPDRIKSAISNRMGHQSGPSAPEMPRDEYVDRASEESFPASDPPAWTTGPSKAAQALNDD
ncbi:MAG: hypothetical protein U0822_14265 [Anaerolineae bacterium]